MANGIFFAPNLNINVVKITRDVKDFSISKQSSSILTMGNTGILHTAFSESLIDALYVSVLSVISEENIAIYRKTPQQNYYTYLGTLSAGLFDFSDYNIVNNQWYHYLASITVPTSDINIKRYLMYELKEELSDGSLSPIYTYINWNVFTICAITESEEDSVYIPQGDMWVLSGNLDTLATVQNRSTTKWDTLGVFPRVSTGEANYASGTISCLLGNMKTVGNVYQYTEKYNINSSYARGNDLYERWLTFCNSNYLKLLRDIKGNSWIVQIIDSPTNTIDVRTVKQMTSISFNWVEVEAVADFSIIQKEDDL